ncbi:MAG TPA: hypothetical protein VF613_15600 [Longimicrobium sp.]
MSSTNRDLENILKWAVIIIVAIAALKVALAVLGIAWLLGGFLLFRVLPLVLLVWLALKAWEWFRGPRGTSPAPPPSSF